jgi:hypothetical protein
MTLSTKKVRLFDGDKDFDIIETMKRYQSMMKTIGGRLISGDMYINGGWLDKDAIHSLVCAIERGYTDLRSIEILGIMLNARHSMELFKFIRLIPKTKLISIDIKDICLTEERAIQLFMAASKTPTLRTVTIKGFIRTTCNVVKAISDMIGSSGVNILEFDQSNFTDVHLNILKEGMRKSHHILSLNLGKSAVSNEEWIKFHQNIIPRTPLWRSGVKSLWVEDRITDKINRRLQTLSRYDFKAIVYLVYLFEKDRSTISLDLICELKSYLFDPKVTYEHDDEEEEDRDPTQQFRDQMHEEHQEEEEEEEEDEPDGLVYFG